MQTNMCHLKVPVTTTTVLETPFVLPDVDAAEHREHQAQQESHGHGQQSRQQAVEDEFEQLKRGVTSDPHSVEAVRGDGLRDDIFKTDLSGDRREKDGDKMIRRPWSTQEGAWRRWWIDAQAATSRHSRRRLMYHMKTMRLPWL